MVLRDQGGDPFDARASQGLEPCVDVPDLGHGVAGDAERVEPGQESLARAALQVGGLTGVEVVPNSGLIGVIGVASGLVRGLRCVGHGGSSFGLQV